MKKTWVLPALFLLALGCSSEDPVATEYGLIWQDEFDEPAGQLPDPSNWSFNLGSGWGNAQLELDTNRLENCSTDGEGHLAITAIKEDFQGFTYTSARISTKGLFQLTYGRFEARIKLPVGQGIWPAFWMLGSNIDDVRWPNCGEIDIMEFLGDEPRTIYGTAHGPGHFGGNGFGGSHTIAQGGFHLGFHEYAIEWSENSIKWFIDGFQYHSMTPDDLASASNWVYDHPFFIILNLAVGGNWPGEPDETTQFPQVMLIDYVRVYGNIPAP